MIEKRSTARRALNEFLPLRRKRPRAGGAKTSLRLAITDKSVLGFYKSEPRFGGLCANAGDCAAGWHAMTFRASAGAPAWILSAGRGIGGQLLLAAGGMPVGCG